MQNTKNPIYRIESCMFKRKKDSVNEPGLLLNEGDIGVLDKNGILLPKVWNLHTVSELVITTEFFKRDHKPTLKC